MFLSLPVGDRPRPAAGGGGSLLWAPIPTVPLVVLVRIVEVGLTERFLSRSGKLVEVLTRSCSRPPLEGAMPRTNGVLFSLQVAIALAGVWTSRPLRAGEPGVVLC